MPQDQLPMLLGFFVFWLVMSTLVGGMILRATVSLFNKLTSPPSSPNVVPEPTIGVAMGIIFLSALLNFVVVIVITILVRGLMNAKSLEPGLNSFLLSFVASIPVMAAVAMGMLPTTFHRALGI